MSNTTYRCYSCGFETTDRAVFLCNQGNGRTSWVMFSCPQCTHTPPPVAEVDPWEKPHYKYPKWEVVETNDGLRVASYSNNGKCCVLNYMSPQHPLWKAPASAIKPDFVGTMADYDKALKANGKARTAAWRTAMAGIKAEYEGQMCPKHPKWDEYQERLSKAREQYRIGPHEDRVKHDGPSVMQKVVPGWRI